MKMGKLFTPDPQPFPEARALISTLGQKRNYELLCF
jgi:hypothetical protein